MISWQGNEVQLAAKSKTKDSRPETRIDFFIQKRSFLYCCWRFSRTDLCHPIKVRLIRFAVIPTNRFTYVYTVSYELCLRFQTIDQNQQKSNLRISVGTCLLGSYSILYGFSIESLSVSRRYWPYFTPITTRKSAVVNHNFYLFLLLKNRFFQNLNTFTHLSIFKKRNGNTFETR